MRRILYACLVGLSTTSVLAQTGIKITYPESRAVFQRNNDNTSTIFLSGTYYQAVDSLQGRLVAEVTGQGINTNWTTFQRNPQGSVFQGAVRGTGGWYRLEVQAFQGGKVIAQDVIRKVGIGEVFIITGQSNAQGFLDYGAASAADDRVNCVTYNNIAASSLADPPAPTFEQLSANSIIGPRGQSAWCWGKLGDLLAQQYNVPVLFINTAWEATSIRNWIESFDDKLTKNIFALGTPNEYFPKGMPYANLRIALRYYCSLQGMRAVLWQQGENDNLLDQNNDALKFTQEEYRAAMQSLVDKTRSDTRRYPAWILARSSRIGFPDGNCISGCKGNKDCEKACGYTYINSPKFIAAQTSVINTFNNNVYAGPFTDVIQPNRPDGIHFSGDGLLQLAQAWYESMSPVFFAASIPLLPQAQPVATVNCGPTNNSVSVSLPSGYQSYEWRTGQTGRALTITQPGLYQAKLKDGSGNTYLSPVVEVSNPIQPAVPTVSVAQQGTAVAAAQQQVCADSVLSLVANVGPQSQAVWSNGSTQRTLTIATAGTYSVQAVNTYGCKSSTSSGISLVVRPRLITPTIEQVGAFTLQANLPGFPNNEQFDWRRGTQFLNNQNGPTAKAVISGPYSARAKAVFTLPGSSITCYSGFSNELQYTANDAGGGMNVYPNPSANGVIAIETVEDLQNADITIATLTGQTVYSAKVASFNERKVINVQGLTAGQYIVRVRSQGFNVARRVLVVP
ncbi:T9SS type A sorting domain-containing protein [Fibrella sp. HMF5335]|uniref:T9SS type A sorting domain-containing protein n=2 Tax=Fibrella rubiginis TaxID=2817060 RepID=A0A939K439_9BACT|nr:T9SS type A sorting domain-containing protein [Fibrella rubiginis]